MIKFLLVGAAVYLMYRFWDTSQNKLEHPQDNQEPDQYTDYEEIE